MKAATVGKFVGLAAIAVMMGADGCESGFNGATSGDGALVLQTPKNWSDWSEPVPVEELNTTFSDTNPSLSNDGLTVYFNSDRTGTFGGTDLWVAHRESKDSSWGTPVNLGSVINTASNEAGPSISENGRLLFFVSTRSGGAGGADIYVSRRTDEDDDFGWETPENLGSDVNTSGADQAPHFQKKGEGGNPSLYFNSGTSPDLYVAPMTADGRTLGPAVAISPVNSIAQDAGASVSKNGLELYFHSDRAGGFGAFDLYVSIRDSVDDAWSAPVNLGSPPNSTDSSVGDFGAAISSDGRTLMSALVRAPSTSWYPPALLSGMAGTSGRPLIGAPALTGRGPCISRIFLITPKRSLIRPTGAADPAKGAWIIWMIVSAKP